MNDSICMSIYPVIISHEFAGVIVEFGEKWKVAFDGCMNFFAGPIDNRTGDLEKLVSVFENDIKDL